MKSLLTEFTIGRRLRVKRGDVAGKAATCTICPLTRNEQIVRDTMFDVAYIDKNAQQGAAVTKMFLEGKAVGANDERETINSPHS
ncbi:hypothetical protein [Trinickia sp. EG282A]|uniref:hypothetical protein n=1 Tax=Trinickia sp. EG282A TaxID=3237013 RepID=UPI0034D2AA49